MKQHGNTVMTYTLVPITEYTGFDKADHTVLTCKNHPNLTWYSKDPFDRSIFYISWDLGPECECSWRELAVRVPNMPEHA